MKRPFVYLMVAGCALGCHQPGGVSMGSGGAGGNPAGGGSEGSGGAGTGGSGNDGRDASPEVTPASRLTTAMATWAAVKPGCPRYHYASYRSSVFGYCATTTIEIANDQPVRRSFISQSSCGQAAETTEEWDEVDVSQLGTHAHGEPAMTVEQLMHACEDILAQDPITNTLSLIVDSSGVPVVCIYRPHACVDDCDVGFRLTSFGCGGWSADASADALSSD